MNDKTYEFLKELTGKDGIDLERLLKKDPDLLRYAYMQENLDLLLEHVKAPKDLKKKVYKKIVDYEEKPDSLPE